MTIKEPKKNSFFYASSCLPHLFFCLFRIFGDINVILFNTFHLCLAKAGFSSQRKCLFFILLLRGGPLPAEGAGSVPL